MKGRMSQWFITAMLALSVCAEAAAETQINTDSLRLTFDGAGNLQSAVACFPACKGENARVQQFGDTSVIRFKPAREGGWTQTENSTETHYELTFRQASGVALTWRIPFRGYRVELQHSGVNEITLRSGESFRPREAAGFGNWLEQSRYVILHSGDARQIGFDDTDTTEVEAEQWLGYRNRWRQQKKTWMRKSTQTWLKEIGRSTSDLLSQIYLLMPTPDWVI